MHTDNASSGSAKPSTPARNSSSSSSSQGNGNVKPAVNGIPRTVGSESRRAKPVFTSSLNFPESRPMPLFGEQEPIELSRGQRRSKVEAISRLDKAGTPVSLTASGPTATSFLPAGTRQGSAAPSGPSPSRNPLHRPLVNNPPFDIHTVRTNAPRHVTSRGGSRLFGLEECPVFYPTSEEFADPMAFIDSIGPSAKPHGMCKVIPPEGWRMPFSLEMETFRFKTRLQKLNSLEAASRAKITFLEQLGMFHHQRDGASVAIPKINRRPLDVWNLRKEVNKMGGHLEVDRIGAWATIADMMGHEGVYAQELREAYVSIVLPFDTWAVRARSVSGSPLTPLQSTNATRGVAPPGFVGASPGSPTRQRGRMSATTPTSRISPRMRMPAGGPSLPRALSLPEQAGMPSTPPMTSNTWASAPVGLPTITINVPGFSNRDGSESELSEEETPRKMAGVVIPEYQKGEVSPETRGVY